MPDPEPPSKTPEELAGPRYALGEQFSKGGMGGLWYARESATGRTIALKRILGRPDAESFRRFLNEARITARLEHPNIVPVHGLGTDPDGQPFYTMKLVQGSDLAGVLKQIAKGDSDTIARYPLAQLLIIFQKVCDAVAFAHSHRVIHRDLKPANIMLGPFGEVLVMDWGLAKDLGLPTGKPTVDPPSELIPDSPSREDQTARTELDPSSDKECTTNVKPEPLSDDKRAKFADPEPSPDQAGVTLPGQAFGSPHYMAPEQARGDIHLHDPRTDIYALGAILYQILSLRRPVSGTTAGAILARVIDGDLDPLRLPRLDTSPDEDAELPTNLRRPKLPRLELRHLPESVIPESLAAVVLRAIAFNPERRYKSVPELQGEITAYQNGFATSAEKAGAWKQLTLLIKRNRAASLGVAAVLVVGTTLGIKASIEGRRAEREATAAKAALTALRRTAPSLVQLAASEAAVQRFDTALKSIDASITIDPELGEAYWRRGWILLGKEAVVEALAALREAEAKAPNQRYTPLISLVERLAAVPSATAPGALLAKPIVDHLSEVGAKGEATPYIRYFETDFQERSKFVEERMALWLGPRKEQRGKIYTRGPYSVWAVSNRGTVGLNINVAVESLAPLRGLPIDALSLQSCGVTDLEALRGMQLVSLSSSLNPIADLGPLKGMPLTSLTLFGGAFKDISALATMPLNSLELTSCEVEDITPLRGAPLEILSLRDCPVTDYSPLRGMRLRKFDSGRDFFHDCSVLRGMPLEEANLDATSITDLSPLVGLPLKSLALLGKHCPSLRPLLLIPTLEKLSVTTPIENLLPLRHHPHLKVISHNASGYRSVTEFWAEYDVEHGGVAVVAKNPQIVPVDGLTAAAGPPIKFRSYYKFDDPGYRIWTRSGAEWQEKAPSGSERAFRTVAQGTVDGRLGSILRKVGTEDFEVFVSNANVRGPRIYFRRNAGPWALLGNMEDLDSSPPTAP